MGCELHFRFPTIKLLDYRERLAELEANRNPVAALVLAHLAAQQTRADPARRLQEKLTIVRRLYDLGYSPEQVRLAFGFVDWLLRLPDILKGRCVQELRTFEEERQMIYITSVEEVSIEKGRVEGLIADITVALELKFGDSAQPIIAEIKQITDLTVIEHVLAHIKSAPTLDDLRRIYAPSITDN